MLHYAELSDFFYVLAQLGMNEMEYPGILGANIRLRPSKRSKLVSGQQKDAPVFYNSIANRMLARS